VASFEYEVVKYPAEAFSRIVFFCSEQGECSVEHVPNEDLDRLKKALNERGKQGWELVQLAFGKDGAIGFWKRRQEDHAG
jgi:hypothetical protein